MNVDDVAGPNPPTAPLPGDPGPGFDVSTLPAGPPWSVDLLADLHAGRYPAQVSGELRRRIAGDQWAASVLTALDATVDELSLLPTPQMPERFALRLDEAIAAEHRAATDASSAPEAGAATGAGARSSTGTGVPQPRQGVDESVTAARFLGQQAAGARPIDSPQAAGGRSTARRRPPPAGPSPVLPFRQPGPTPPPARSSGVRPLTQPTAPANGSQMTGGPVPAAPGMSGASGSVPRGDLGTPGGALDAARARRRRWIGGLAAAAALVVLGTATVASLQHSGNTGEQAASGSASRSVGPAANALELDPGRFGDALKQIEGKRPLGPLQDATTYSRCLAANAINPSAVSGVMSATFEGKPAAAIAVVVDAQHSKVVVVGPGCGIDGAADQLAAQTVSR